MGKATILAIAVIVLALGLVGNADYRDAVSEHDRYCRMVDAGYWPDYKRTFDKECRYLMAKGE